MIASINPYWDTTFGEFFVTLWTRMVQFFGGKIPFSALASDEIQIGVLGLIAIACAMVGTLLVLKKMTMLANSLSHTVLLGIVLAYLVLMPFTTGILGDEPKLNLTLLMAAALISALLTNFLTQLLTQVVKLQEDASIGLVFTTLFALGVVLVTIFTRNAHIGTEAVMGNADALHQHDLVLASAVAAIDFIVLFICFKEFKITAFDPSLAQSLGISNGFFNTLLMVLVAATAISAFRAIGVLLVLAFLVAPVLTARLFTDRLHTLIFLAALIGVLSAILAVAMARHILSVHQIPLSTSGMVVAILAVIYVLALCFSPRKGWISKLTLYSKNRKNPNFDFRRNNGT